MANYGAVIEVSVKGQEALNKLEGSAQKIQSLIQGIKQQRNIFDQAVGSEKTRELKRNLENLVATFAGAKEGARQFKITVGGNEQTINMYSKTLAGLNHQLQAFRGIASNATVGTDQYRNAVVAANKVANEFARTQAKAMSTGTGVTGTAKNVQEVLNLSKAVPDTIEGLTFYKNKLEELLSTLKLTSNEFRAVEEAITGVDVRLNKSRLTGQTSKITPAAGPTSRLDTEASFNRRAAYAKQLGDLEYKQLVTGQALVKAKLTQTQQEELQNRLAQASDALASGELDTAKRLTNEIRNQRILYERLNRAQESLMRPSSMTAGAAESITGKRPGGLPPVPGSPAALAQAAKAATASSAQQSATAVNNQVAAQKRYNNLLTSAQILEQKSLEYKAKGLQVDQQIIDAQNLINNIQQNSGNVTKQYLDALDNVLNTLRNELLLRKAIFNVQKAQTAAATGAKPAASSAGTKGTQGGGKGAAIQNALIGGAFPLLFGGGPGAVLGGFAGGFIPGNPMMSIVTSAIGTIIDRVVAGARVAGEAVRTLDTAIQHMSDSALFSSKETEFLAKKFEEYGRYSLALQVVQEELNRKIGYDGVASLQKLGDSSSNLNKAWADLNLQLQAALAGPLAGLLQFIADVLKLAPSTASQANVNTITKNLNPEQAAQFQKEMFASLSGGEAAQKPIIAKYEALAKAQTKTNIKLSNEQLTAGIQNGEKLYTTLADLERDLNDKKRQYAEQYADMVLALARQQYDLTEQLQRKAFDTQVQSLSKELEILQKQAQIRIEISRNALQERQLNAAPGTALATSLETALEEYRIRRNEIDNEAANNERQFKLEMIKFDVENERYKLDVAKTIARTNYDNTVKIARINTEINKQNDAVSRENYRRQIAIASVELARVEAQLQADTAQIEAQKKIAQAQGTLTQDAERYYNSLLGANTTALEKYQPLKTELKTAKTIFKAPSSIPAMGALPSLTADTRALDNTNKSLRNRLVTYQELLNISDKLNEDEKARLALIEKINQQATAPLSQIIEAQIAQNANQKYYNDSIMKGSLPALSEQLASIKALAEPYLALLDTKILELEAQKSLTGLTAVEVVQLDELIKRRQQLAEFKTAAVAGAEAANTPEQRLQAAFVGVKGNLNELTDPVNALVAGANRVGDAFGQAFSSIVNGSASAQEAIGTMLQSIGENFVSMAAEIIAQQTVMIILGTILKALGIGGGGSAPKTDTLSNFNAGALQYRATGGPVTSNSPYIVGEKGPELFVPGTGGSVVPTGDLRSAMGAAPGSGGSPVLNMSFETSTINGVEYVSRDQLEAAMAVTRRQAARDGASRGMSMTLDRLQQSPSTRRRVGF